MYYGITSDFGIITDNGEAIFITLYETESCPLRLSEEEVSAFAIAAGYFENVDRMTGMYHGAGRFEYEILHIGSSLGWSCDVRHPRPITPFSHFTILQPEEDERLFEVLERVRHENASSRRLAAA